MKKKTGLIIGSIGGGLYLFNGIISLYIGYILGLFSTPNLIAGAISLIGTAIATKIMKIGGIIVLTTIPVTIITGIIMFPNATIMGIAFIVVGLPIPFAPPILVIIAGIVFLKNSRT